MAKHRTARGTGRLQQNIRGVRVDTSLALSTLAAADLVSVAAVAASDTEYLMMSADLTYAISGLIAGEGPIGFGIMDGDYTDTEAEEAIEAFSAIDLADKIAQERANRKVRSIGSAFVVFNNGNSKKTKFNWKVAIGQTPKLFGYNQGSAILTTGVEIHIQGTLWIKFL